MSVDTLTRHYGEVLETAATLANTKVADTLYRRAISGEKGSEAAMMFWLKCRAGWRENEMSELVALIDKLAKEVAELKGQRQPEPEPPPRPRLVS